MPEPGPASTTPPPQLPHRRPWISRRFLTVLLLVSVFFNLSQLVAFRDYSAGTQPPYESFHGGELTASDKIARLEISGVIMPPFTERWLKIIDAIEKDDRVKGVLLVVDSPGGLVADSHQIYARLQKLRDKKPITVAMQRIAASGGYYLSMGAGPKAKIFAEPTTWTGSIGVIVPRYNLSELARLWGVKSEPLVTGPFKNTLDPLKEMGPDEQQVWMGIIDDAFQRFVEVIDEGRANLDAEAIKKLATGQVYTAKQALAAGLVDAIGFEDDALESLKQELNLKEVRVIKYSSPSGLIDIVLGASARTPPPTEAADPLSRLLDAGVPRAMYLFGWHPGLRATSF